MTKRRPKILYLTYRDAKDKREWSGTLYYMAQALNKHAGEVIYAGPYNPRILAFFIKAFRRLTKLLFHKNYNVYYNYFLALAYKIHFTTIIKKEKPDVIFAGSSSVEMSLLHVSCPIIYLGDITFDLLKDNYPNFSNLTAFSVWESEYIEKKAFKNASSLIFSSDWAVRSAIESYNVPAEMVHLISYGANMDQIPSRIEALNKNIEKEIRLLFLGVDWVRKGGPVVYKAFKEMKNRGLNVTLTICGCNPPLECDRTDMHIIQFLNKNKPSDFKVLYDILLTTNFLFVPSQSDCTPIAFCEANAFGVPVLTSNVGGITSVIKNGLNGHTLPISTDPSDYADIVQSYSTGILNYSDLVKHSRDYYESNLNWDQWGKAMKSIIENLIPTEKANMTDNLLLGNINKK